MLLPRLPIRAFKKRNNLICVFHLPLHLVTAEYMPSHQCFIPVIKPEYNICLISSITT